MSAEVITGFCDPESGIASECGVIEGDSAGLFFKVKEPAVSSIGQIRPVGEVGRPVFGAAISISVRACGNIKTGL